MGGLTFGSKKKGNEMAVRGREADSMWRKASVMSFCGGLVVEEDFGTTSGVVCGVRILDLERNGFGFRGRTGSFRRPSVTAMLSTGSFGSFELGQGKERR